jgi:molecular chaperone IbpA
MTYKIPVFDPFSFGRKEDLNKCTVGMDEMFREYSNILTDTINSASKYPNYPPYNIKKIDENKYVIEMAIAGFAQSNLEITLENNVLNIKGSISSDDGKENQFLYKGIAERAFSRNFRLADMVEVKNAELINGLLKIWLERIIPEEKKPRKININEKESEKTLLQE